MGESACLLRSFSHPSDTSREAKEGDHMRVLGESVSFGRFMSESLAWEKWSAFSHNRYLEEVEKFSKPGSVAQKKAYFEAHYKKKAAERAAAQLEEANTDAVVEVKVGDQSCTSSCIDSELLKANNQVIATGEQQNLVQNSEAVSPTDVDAHNSMNKEIMVETAKVEEEDMVDQNNYVETSPNIESANQCENVVDHSTIVVAEDEKTPVNPAAERQISASGSLKRLRNYSSKLLTRSQSFKPPSPPVNQATSIQQPICRGNETPKSKKRAGNVAERLSTKTVHMSINFNSRSKEKGKTSPEIPWIGRKRMFTSSLAVSKETSTPPQKVANRASVNGLLKQPVVKLPSESRRCLKPSSASGNKERSPLKCSPFSFKSDERAAKRKEFFQKLEEKANFKEAKQKQRQESCQKRTEIDIIKACQNGSFKAKVNQDSNQGSKLPSNHIKKIPVTRPRSPKLGRKPATTMVQERSSLPPRRPPVTSENSKCVIRKRYQGTTQSVTSLGKKMNAHENLSPNIQS